MRIDIERLSPDELTREGWGIEFTVDSGGVMRLVLAEYAKASRASKRHKFPPRGNLGWYRRLQIRESTIKDFGSVPLPADVVAEARGRLLAAVEALTVVHEHYRN